MKFFDLARRRDGGGRASSVAAIALAAMLAFAAKQYLGGEAVAADAPAQGGRAPSVVYTEVRRAELSFARQYVGQVEAVQFVSIRPQVAGEIEKVHFVEGSIVNEGDVLFTIDSRQFQATVALRKADVARANADHSYAAKYYERLKSSDARSVSAADLDAAQSKVATTKAAVEQANAALKLAQIDLGYCKITAPIAGRIGRAEFTKGNYVSPAGPELASIAQVDPVRVRFSVPDRDYIANIAMFQGGERDLFTSSITLPDGSLYPSVGRRDFEDNTMDSSTGTMTMRVRFPNEDGTLVPGTVVHVSLKPTDSYVSCVIPQVAVMGDSQGDFVYVVDADDKIERRAVELGEDFGSSTAITSGLSEGERVVVRGVQNVRPGMQVSPLPEKPEGEGKTPAELASESGFDLETLPMEGDK